MNRETQRLARSLDDTCSGCRGTLARFINSSCAPNCEAQKWHDAATGEVRVGIFTAEDIDPGIELTYDYMFQHAGTAALAGAYRSAPMAPRDRRLICCLAPLAH